MEDHPETERVAQSSREKTATNPQVFTFCNNLRSQKVILRLIESEINNESVSERILDSLEKIEQLYRELKIQLPESMIYSYAAVALSCSFRRLPENSVDNVFDRRISKLEMINSEFVTDEMRVYMDCMRVLESNPGKLNKWKEKEMNIKYKEDALMVIKCYLTEAMSPIEPALKEAQDELERLEARGKNDDNYSKEKETNPVLEDKVIEDELERLEERGKMDDKESKEKETNPVLEGKGIEDCGTGGGECKSPEVHSPKGREIQGEVPLTRQTANPRRYRGPPKIADSDDMDSEKMDASELNQELVGDPLIDESIGSKKIGTSEPNHPLVGDPLINESIESTKMGTSEPLVGDPLIGESIEYKEMGTSVAKEPLVGDPLIDLKSSNATVSSPLIDESIRIRLDSPKRKIISPLKIYEEKKFKKRSRRSKRKKGTWSPEEEDALREGVEKFGVGKWKLILNSNRDIFSGRQEGDLKDKWRNLMKPTSRK